MLVTMVLVLCYYKTIIKALNILCGSFSCEVQLPPEKLLYFRKGNLALATALQHVDVYALYAYQPVCIYTDHNPLTSLNKMKKPVSSSIGVYCWGCGTYL